MLRTGPRRALALWLALLVVGIVAMAAIAIWLQPDILNTVSGPVH